MLILQYDSRVPRYTSYPTAPHFSQNINHKTYCGWLKNLSSATLSLYFHIPFCVKMCWYCGCFTKVTKRYAPVEDYLRILLQEIDLIANHIEQKNPAVSHIHFGGGSPTILLAPDFELLMTKIRQRFAINKNAEIAIEIDPRNVDEEKILTYAKCGVNRASLGVQDFNPEVQKAVNREQSFDLVDDCIKNFRRNGIENLNLDLIYGLPKQTAEMIKNNIDCATSLKPDRIALFSYAHVPWMKKHMRLIRDEDLPNSEAKFAMFKTAASQLNEKGFAAIGLDHFAAKDDSMTQALSKKTLRRNFQGYTTDKASALIGFGMSAISFLPSGYVQNTSDFGEYQKRILNHEPPIVRGIEMTDDDKLRKKVIDEIMCYLEVDLDAVCDEFKKPKNYFSNELESLRKLESDGLIKIKNSALKINNDAPQIARVVCSFFDKFFKQSIKQHSKVA